MVRAFFGPAFVIGGWQLISTSYGWGVAIVYFGFALCLVECIWEPALLRSRYQLQIALIAIVFALAAAFSIGVVFVSAPLTFYSYAMRKGNYSDGTNIGGIMWNSHFTEMKIAVANLTHEDYENLDLMILPDRWTHEAVILNRPSWCELNRIENLVFKMTRVKQSGPTQYTVTRLPDGSSEIHDTQGSEYSTLASGAGYRLLCSKLPAKYNLQVVFALVSLKPEFLEKTRVPSAPQGGIAMALSEWSGVQSDFDMLDVRPSPSTVKVEGDYKKMRLFSVSSVLSVRDGD